MSKKESVDAASMHPIVMRFLRFVGVAKTPEVVPPIVQMRNFRVRVVRPDGVVHSEAVVESEHRPYVWATRGGVTYIFGGEHHAPVGWKLDIEEFA